MFIGMPKAPHPEPGGPLGKHLGGLAPKPLMSAAYAQLRGSDTRDQKFMKLVMDCFFSGLVL